MRTDTLVVPERRPVMLLCEIVSTDDVAGTWNWHLMRNNAAVPVLAVEEAELSLRPRQVQHFAVAVELIAEDNRGADRVENKKTSS